MTKTVKITLMVFGLLMIGLVGIIVFGMYSMHIEDMYGANQDIFYNSKHGDFVVNHETKELGQIARTWTGFYVVCYKDTLNIHGWWDDKNIEILRLADKDVLVETLRYEDVRELKKAKTLELVERLR